MSESRAESSTADQVFAAFIDGELAREWQRRTALDARALSSVNLSTTLLAAGVAAVTLIGRDDATTVTLVLTWAAGLSLVGTAAAGLVAYWPRRVEAADEQTMRRMLAGAWNISAEDARWECARLGVEGIVSLRRGNKRKGRAARVAGIGQVVSLALVVIALCVQFLVTR